MLAMLAQDGNDFFFEVNNNGYQKVLEKLEFDYAEHKKVFGFSRDQAVGQFSHTFTFEGKLILQNINSLSGLEDIGKNKKPALLVFGSGFAYWVTIQKISIDKSRFLSTGEPLKREFSVDFKRYWYD